MTSTWSQDVRRRLAATPEQPAPEPTEQPVPTVSAPPAWHRFSGRPDQLDLAGYSRAAGVRGRRRLSGLRTLVGHDPVADRVTAATDDILSSITTGRRVVVLGACGGAGTTTVTALLGRCLSHYRPDRTLIAAGSADHGSLAARLGLEAEATEGTVDRALGELVFATSCQMTRILPLDAGLAVLAGHAGDAELLRRSVLRMGSACAVSITDAGRDVEHPTLRDAHAVVVVTPLTLDGTAAARAVDRTIADLYPAAQRLVVSNDTGLASGVTHSAQRDELTTTRTLPLPRDRHVAAGARIDLGRMSERARLAALELSGQVVRAATAGGRPRG